MKAILSGLKDTLRRVVGVPREAVDKAVADEAEQKKQGKEKAKNG